MIMADRLVHGPTKTTSLVLIHSFDDKQDRADLKERSAYECCDASADETFARKLCARCCQREPVEESADDEDCAAYRKENRDPPRNVPPSESGEHTAYSSHYRRGCMSELRRVRGLVIWRNNKDMTS